MLRRRAPQLIAAAIIFAVTIVVLLEILEDVFIEGTPAAGGTIGAVFNGIVLFTRNVTSMVSSWGYTGVFFLMLLESSSLPLPSEVILPFAGYLVSNGKLDFWLTVSVATLAGIAGSFVDYYVGLRAAHALSEHRIWGKVFFTKNQLETAVGWFGKYGAVIVFFSRLIPGFRTIVSFPAGGVRMPISKFVAYTTAGCIVWNAVLIYVGYYLGSRWTEVAGISHNLIIVVATSVAAGFVVFMAWRRTRARKRKSQGYVS